ncbi:MAG TPA: tetratricopeptide repeat protein, partial [Thermoanaerobaculia bacterium]|nr:tetratricopeptide repeat protein [Thermoanaerobaculia bacterium]
MAVQRDKVIANAEKLVAKGKIDAAIKEYERLLDDNPNDVNTLNRIGDLWVRINRNDEAVKTFGKIADHYSKDGFFLKAIAIYKKINKLDPSKLDIYAKLADLYAKQGLAMEAKSQYQVLADYYLKHGDPANALSIYRKISELDPSSINVHVKLADLYGQNNQTAEALKEYDRVGRMLLKRGMLDEAVQVFKKALKIDARNIDLVESLVTALLEARDYDNALSIVETALEANRDHPRLTGMWGRIQLAKGDVQSARSTLER